MVITAKISRAPPKAVVVVDADNAAKMSASMAPSTAVNARYRKDGTAMGICFRAVK